MNSELSNLDSFVNPNYNLQFEKEFLEQVDVWHQEAVNASESYDYEKLNQIRNTVKEYVNANREKVWQVGSENSMSYRWEENKLAEIFQLTFPRPGTKEYRDLYWLPSSWEHC